MENTENNTEKVEQVEEQPGKKTTDTSTANAENMIPKSRFDQVNSQKNELNDTLKGLVDELKNDIPEEYQDLVPDTKPADQIKWIRNASKKGLFSSKPESSPDAETPGTSKTQVDTSNMSAFDMLAHGFKNQK
jgi:hypothetical protein